MLHVAANLICIFLVSRHLVLLPTFPKFLHSFCGLKECNRLTNVLKCIENVIFYTGVKLGISDLGKKHYLRVFEDRVLRRMLGGGG